MKRKLVAAAVIPLAITLSACGSTSMQAGEQAVRVKGSYIFPAAPEVIGCLNPETQEYIGPDDHYDYPSRDISYDAVDDQSTAERAPYEAVTNDAIRMKVPVSITFAMTSNCDVLKEFHRKLGVKYKAWLDGDGNYGQGWLDLLNYAVGQPAYDAVLGVTQKYDWLKVYNDEDVRVEYQQALQTVLPKVVKARTGQAEDVFTNFQVTVFKPAPVDQNLLSTIDQAQARVQEAEGRKRSAEADRLAAQAETAAAEERAKKTQADLGGFPDVQSYLQDQENQLKKACIDKAPNCTPWPQPIIGLPR